MLGVENAAKSRRCRHWPRHANDTHRHFRFSCIELTSMNMYFRTQNNKQGHGIVAYLRTLYHILWEKYTPKGDLYRLACFFCGKSGFFLRFTHCI